VRLSAGDAAQVSAVSPPGARRRPVQSRGARLLRRFLTDLQQRVNRFGVLTLNQLGDRDAQTVPVLTVGSRNPGRRHAVGQADGGNPATGAVGGR
jgi:hypothetical protein